MSKTLLLLPVLALAAGMSTVPVIPAAAQCRLCDTPTTGREEGSPSGPISLEIETSLDFDLVDGAGKTIATTLTDFDGFFLFERAPYGEYRIRLSKETAEATGLPADLKVKVSVSAAKSIVRLGSIHVEPPPRIASLE